MGRFFAAEGACDFSYRTVIYSYFNGCTLALSSKSPGSMQCSGFSPKWKRFFGSMTRYFFPAEKKSRQKRPNRRLFFLSRWGRQIKAAPAAPARAALVPPGGLTGRMEKTKGLRQGGRVLFSRPGRDSKNIANFFPLWYNTHKKYRPPPQTESCRWKRGLSPCNTIMM